MTYFLSICGRYRGKKRTIISNIDDSQLIEGDAYSREIVISTDEKLGIELRTAFNLSRDNYSSHRIIEGILPKNHPELIINNITRINECNKRETYSLVNHVIIGHIYSFYSDIYIYQKLFDLGANIDDLLWCAIIHNNIKAIRFILNKKSNSDNCINKAMINACSIGSLEIMKILIGYGADVYYDNNHIFKIAFQRNHSDIIKFLENCDIKINPTIIEIDETMTKIETKIETESSCTCILF